MPPSDQVIFIGDLVSLDYKLTSGDSAEILTSKVTRGPSLDWLGQRALSSKGQWK